jgi:hypothetical protein
MANIEWFEALFGTLSGMAAALSAHLWFRASKVKVPPFTGDSYDGKGPFTDALRSQSDANANAAFAATFAALFQVLAIGSKILSPYFGLK